MTELVHIVAVDIALTNAGIARAQVSLETGNIFIKDLTLVSTDPQAGKTVRKNSDDIRRAREIRTAIAKASIGADLMIAEVPVGAQNARAATAFGITYGLLAGVDIPLVEVTPTEVKLASFGTKNASKDEIIQWAVAKYPNLNWLRVKRKGVMVLTNANEHLADAVAAVHAGVLTEQFKFAKSMFRPRS